MRGRGPLETAVFIISLVFIGGTLGVFLYDGLAVPNTPATVLVEFDKEAIVKTPDGWRVPLTLINKGNQAAENVTVLAAAGGKAGNEAVQVTVRFLPEGSRRRAFVVFERDPRDAALTARAMSYNLP